MSDTNTASPPGAEVLQSAPKRGVPMWAQIIVWVALLGLLTVVALGLRRTQQGTVQVGDIIPDFTLSFFDGYKYKDKSEVKLSELKGKVIVVNFWASWCKPCEQEAAEMEAAWRTYEQGDQVIFIGADYVDTEPEARGYLKKFNITYPNGPDLGTRISQMFRIQGVPETYFIDQTGKLVYAQIGPFASESEIHAIIDPLIKK
jgi:cytochrome c biogenesis protein CcmG/thiol:disulfide interchange protein DsbE